MPRVNANGIDLYFEVYGEGAAILGIHGTPSSAHLWVDAARELATLGRCIIYDRRGFSRSGRPDPFEAADLADHVADAAALLDALSAVPAVVIGRSTGGQIALALAHRFPGAVQALVLLEAALFSVDPEAQAWADRLRRTVLQAAAADPTSAAQAVIQEVLGARTWESFPQELRELFAAASPADLAEIRGRGLDLSGQPLALTDEELAGMTQPTLLVSAEDSPAVLGRVNDRLAEALPHHERLLVTGGHVINPAHPGVIDFVSRVLGLGQPPAT